MTNKLRHILAVFENYLQLKNFFNKTIYCLTKRNSSTTTATLFLLNFFWVFATKLFRVPSSLRIHSNLCGHKKPIKSSTLHSMYKKRSFKLHTSIYTRLS
eukprot:NODE_42_length_29671_cov_0.584810.p24 type:complete len:100 gc:universal NODE_42_length_29671_cov_0.584810:25578-25279(-)